MSDFKHELFNEGLSTCRPADVPVVPLVQVSSSMTEEQKGLKVYDQYLLGREFRS